MSGDKTEGYLSELKRELRMRWTPSARFFEETRGHLADAMAAGERQGLSREQAEREALARFGSFVMSRKSDSGHYSRGKRASCLERSA
jgi:hypothetical protein